VGSTNGPLWVKGGGLRAEGAGWMVQPHDSVCALSFAARLLLCVLTSHAEAHVILKCSALQGVGHGKGAGHLFLIFAMDE
jgi:hypothetical protein